MRGCQVLSQDVANSPGRNETMSAPVLVIGCGRRDYGHDSLGPLVADRVALLDLPGVEVRAEEAPSVDLVDSLGERAAADPVRALVIVDAAEAGLENPIGTWLRLDYHQVSLCLRSRGSGGTHELGIPKILELARTLGVLPATVWVYAGFGHGFEFSSHTSEVTTELAAVLADVVAHDVCKLLAAEGLLDKPSA